MRMRYEYVICFGDVFNVQVFGQDSWSLEPCVEKYGKSVGLQPESGGACVAVSQSMRTVRCKSSYRTTR